MPRGQHSLLDLRTAPQSHHRIQARRAWRTSRAVRGICTVVNRRLMLGSRLPGPMPFGSRCSDSSARGGRCLAFGAQLARLLAAAGVADGKPVRRRPVSGGPGRRAAVQPRARHPPAGDRRRVRRVVSAVFAARSVRRCVDGPLGPPSGADRRQRGPGGVGGDRGNLPGGRCRQCARAVRRAGGQRPRPVRRIGAFGRPACMWCPASRSSR